MLVLSPGLTETGYGKGRAARFHLPLTSLADLLEFGERHLAELVGERR